MQLKSKVGERRRATLDERESSGFAYKNPNYYTRQNKQIGSVIFPQIIPTRHPQMLSAHSLLKYLMLCLQMHLLPKLFVLLVSGLVTFAAEGRL